MLKSLYVFNQFWTKKTPGNKQKLSLKKYILTSLTLKEKKRRICIPNFNRVQLLGDPFLEKVNSHELHSLNMAQYKH